jgi:hypothetical protein
MSVPSNLGMMLLAVWLILFGLLTAPFLHLSFAYSGDILAVLAIVAPSETLAMAAKPLAPLLRLQCRHLRITIE